MVTTAKKHDIRLKPGTVIKGKWNGHRYRVIRPLGSGTVGIVYLCQHKDRYVALKISVQSLNMTAEVQALTILQKTKVQDIGLGPYLFDVDDWEVRNKKTLSFYVMEYIKGISLRTFVKQNGIHSLATLLFQLLEQLEQLHRLGYIFGDLKSENIIVIQQPPTVRLIDVGGMTKIGRSVKEYTNFYDRAYWRLGKRLAEPSYDLFAVAMVCIAVFYPRKFTRVANNDSFLQGKLWHIQTLRPYAPVLSKALKNQYTNAQTMRNDILKVMTMTNRREQDRPVKKFLTEVLLIGGSASLFYSLSIVLGNLP